MTRARESTLSILREANEPLSAAGVFRLAAGFDQATVYRALHYLEEKGLAVSFILACEEHGTERYYAVSDSGKHRHWFHCERCHRFVDLGDCAIEPLVERYETAYGIDIRSHTLSLTGTCADCRAGALQGQRKRAIHRPTR
ncbi:MAG TPA: transcriptional repressor [Treponemataceae bacterium]|nr:transcriptional repressor [Treponemataceae bacterium]